MGNIFDLCFESHTLPNDGKYVGTIFNGKANGEGICTWISGERKGNRYEGYFKDDMRHKGKTVYVNGDIYEGGYKDDKRHGFGKKTYLNGCVYEGEYYQDMRHGQGKFTWADGSMYEGEYKNNEKNGIGKYTWADGDVYEGSWKDDTMHGRGTQKDNAGRLLKSGLWDHDKFMK
jgi:hypothetical protein